MANKPQCSAAGGSPYGQEGAKDPVATPTVVSMRALHRADLTSYLTARLNHQGDLVLSGQDLMSTKPDHTMRSDEYEYTKTYDFSTFPVTDELPASSLSHRLSGSLRCPRAAVVSWLRRV
jgi:hypothetical protein